MGAQTRPHLLTQATDRVGLGLWLLSVLCVNKRSDPAASTDSSLEYGGVDLMLHMSSGLCVNESADPATSADSCQW